MAEEPMTEKGASVPAENRKLAYQDRPGGEVNLTPSERDVLRGKLNQQIAAINYSAQGTKNRQDIARMNAGLAPDKRMPIARPVEGNADVGVDIRRTLEGRQAPPPTPGEDPNKTS